MTQRVVLLKERAVGTLVSDRSAPFYLLSVYLHPDHVKKEIEDILNAWRNVEKKTDRVVIAGTSTMLTLNAHCFVKDG